MVVLHGVQALTMMCALHGRSWAPTPCMAAADATTLGRTTGAWPDNACAVADLSMGCDGISSAGAQDICEGDHSDRPRRGAVGIACGGIPLPPPLWPCSLKLLLAAATSVTQTPFTSKHRLLRWFLGQAPAAAGARAVQRMQVAAAAGADVGGGSVPLGPGAWAGGAGISSARVQGAPHSGQPAQAPVTGSAARAGHVPASDTVNSMEQLHELVPVQLVSSSQQLLPLR